MANALDTMLRGQPLRDVPQLLDILAIVLLASLSVVAALRWSAPATAAVIAALAVALLVGAQLAFQSGWMVAVVVPLVALTASTLGIAGVGAGRLMMHRRTQRAGASAKHSLTPSSVNISSFNYLLTCAPKCGQTAVPRSGEST